VRFAEAFVNAGLVQGCEPFCYKLELAAKFFGQNAEVTFDFF